jgi:hypothetical protein
MENAHLRMGLLEFERNTEKIATRIRVQVSHYIGENDDAHLLSVFGNDSDVGAVTAAIYEKARFRLTFPSGEMQEISLGEGAICYRGISIPGRKQAIRHIIGLSEELRGLKSLSRTFVLRPEPTVVWTALVHRYGLPGLPEWAKTMLQTLRENGRIGPVDCIGCCAAVINATCEELLDWMEVGVGRGELTFPEINGPVRWSNGALVETLRPKLDLMQKAA